MSLMLTRMFAYFTVVCYLVVGTVVARFVVAEEIHLGFTSSYFSVLQKVSISKSHDQFFATVPLMNFKNFQKVALKIPVRKKSVVKITPVRQMNHPVKENFDLPFQETIVLKKIFINEEMPTNLLASYQEFKFEEKPLANSESQKQDEVSIKMAAPSKDFGEDFFEYPTKKTVETKNSKINDESIESENVDELIAEKEDQVSQVATPVNEPDFFDYPAKVTTQKPAATPVQVSVGVAPMTDAPVVESHAQPVVALNTSKMTTHQKPENQAPVANSLIANNSKMTTQYHSELMIQILGSDLLKNSQISGFEVRFQDSTQETLEDFGSGSVKFEGILANPKMTRAAVFLKRGYIPTTTDLFLEEGQSRVTIPLLEEEVVNGLNDEFEANGSIGSLLIELDDETEIAKLDVPFGKVIKLDGDLKETEKENFRYQLFVGVRTGNAMISYHRSNGVVVHKIVHVHENEMVFDANFYEDIADTKIKLSQEDLISKVTSPLNIVSGNVKIFASNQVSTKLNTQTYRLNFSSGNLAGRKYIELNHQEEPIFVGFRENNKINVPSESMIRYMLSQFEQAKLGERCLVQINLAREAIKFEAYAESSGSSLVLYNQALDSDGKFYESVSEKTRKLVIVGENQASGEASRDGKINIKIQYADGTDQYLNSYCSPNTYLVEQL